MTFSLSFLYSLCLFVLSALDTVFFSLAHSWKYDCTKFERVLKFSFRCTKHGTLGAAFAFSIGFSSVFFFFQIYFLFRTKWKCFGMVRTEKRLSGTNVKYVYMDCSWCLHSLAWYISTFKQSYSFCVEYRKKIIFCVMRKSEIHSFVKVVRLNPSTRK